MNARQSVLAEVEAELARQDELWGEQNHPDWTANDLGIAPMIEPARHAQGVCEEKFRNGCGSYSDILLEEVAEANDEEMAGNEVNLREELVQVAAVAMAWIECIDRRREKRYA